MSREEHWTGNLRKIDFPEDFTWDQKLDKLILDGWKIDKEMSDEDHYIENEVTRWQNEGKNKPFLGVIKGEIYEIFDWTETDESCNGIEVFPNEDGSYSFNGSFYNGGTDLLESLEHALDDVVPDKSKVIFEKSFDGWDMGYIEQDLDWDIICKDIPMDETNEIPDGRFTMKITWTPYEE